MHYFFSAKLRFRSLLDEDPQANDNIKHFCVNLLAFVRWRLKRCENYAISGLLALFVVTSNNSFGQERLLYRYINEDGVQVLTYSVPTWYVSKGYEIVDSRGRLIKVVPPALSPEAKEKEAAAQAEMERLESWDRQLLKRYSRISDIEAAKKRKLAEISANINILQANVINLNNERDKLQSKAAAMERRGQPVAAAILDKINGIREELAVTAEKIQLRQTEYQAQTDKFDSSIARFLIIRPEDKYNR